ncbi:FAD-dependent monooxygenase [Streptomyces sp. Je 1-4]|uniref:FAD-dependent monooxygenase n=1 Tax=Streptomyces TaxID=1883 RepID=UPI0021DAFFC1|nr:MULTISPECIES: FAD-dependent monooxygenase [unclassified Streptomyces]UYB41821.1 FAD-dependent monooxygenase [Streptomyces sp. Je 1-4]UZQ38086.1 FAD-dependent monooxygenase [Streptomyces sp. Je 1-4] [Streptomyces sp. Je 1-4 4N24]UZQ45503.1 FAD-dependent monooxygenase [Streptomyces sp. Je 1-4] [Streptomyces sp. Je 1-4 4N24_ara]
MSGTVSPSPRTRPRTVLISGASIAGPALAHWLHRYGFAVTVVERAPELRTGGYKVDIRGAAVEVAERMGILEDIQRASTDMRTGAYVNDDGERIATLPADIFGARVGRDDEIMRGDLARILYERTRADVEYVFGDSITSLTERPDDHHDARHDGRQSHAGHAGHDTDGTCGVEVTFERGAPRRFDLVVGADGLHSNVRRLTFGPEEQFVRHLGAYISAFSLPNELGLDREELYHAVPGKLICVYSSSGDPAAKGMLTFRSPRLAYDHRKPAEQLALLEAAFKDVGVAPSEGWTEVPRLLEAAREADDFYFDGLQLIEMDRWSRGRVVLLGDAAHCASPASGQGTGMALVGAYVLAGALAEAGRGPEEAFDRYEKEMRGYVAVNHALAAKFAKEMTADSRRQIRFRHLMMRILPHMPWKNLVAKKIAEDVQRGANAITLQDHPVPAAATGRAPADGCPTYAA